jgi:hypothetical protein
MKDEDWWDRLSEKEQQEYLEEHPKSKITPTSDDEELEGDIDDTGEGEEDSNATEPSKELVEETVNKLESSLEDDEEFQNNKKIVDDYVNSNDDDEPDEVALTKAQFAGACLCFMTALTLAALMPESAATIFSASYMVGDIFVNSIGNKAFDDDKKSKKQDKNSVELLPDEEAQAAERKRNLSELSVDENGEYINTKNKPKDSVDHLVTLMLSNMGKANGTTSGTS